MTRWDIIMDTVISKMESTLLITIPNTQANNRTIWIIWPNSKFITKITLKEFNTIHNILWITTWIIWHSLSKCKGNNTKWIPTMLIYLGNKHIIIHRKTITHSKCIRKCKDIRVINKKLMEVFLTTSHKTNTIIILKWW